MKTGTPIRVVPAASPTPFPTWSSVPGEDLVLHGVGPTADLTVPGQPLLLRPVGDAREPGVGDEPAARVLRSGGAVVLRERVLALIVRHALQLGRQPVRTLAALALRLSDHLA